MPRSRCSIAAVAALVAVVGVLTTSAPAGAADYGTFTLSNVSQTASWSGVLQGSGPGLPEQCVSADVCDFVSVRVKLPAGVWDEPGGMLVAVRPREEFANAFNLYLYGPGQKPVTDKPIDRSENLYSVGNQAVWVENPANGLYTVVVAYFAGAIGAPPATYDGYVSFDRGLTVKREELNNSEPYTQTFVAFGLSSPTPAALLPDLVPTISNFHIETGTCITPSVYLCSPWATQQPSCYPEETAGLTSSPLTPGEGPTRCLRFDHGEYNFGDGPLEIHLYPGQGTVVSEGAIEADVYQRIYSSDGGVDQRLAGGAIFHTAHGHFHGLRWRTVTLHERLPDGRPGAEVARMPDKGVCMLDIRNGRFGQRRGSPLAYGNSDAAPCVSPSHQDANDPTFPNEPYIQSGISVGWADIYPWALIDQYIDISDVPDGKYVVVAKVDTLNLITEKREANNTTMACVEISGITAKTC